MSWIGAETNNIHLAVPRDLFEDADKKARDLLLEDMED
jgi:20S proteasome subunit alpha 7